MKNESVHRKRPCGGWRVRLNNNRAMLYTILTAEEKAHRELHLIFPEMFPTVRVPGTITRAILELFQYLSITSFGIEEIALRRSLASTVLNFNLLRSWWLGFFFLWEIWECFQQGVCGAAGRLSPSGYGCMEQGECLLPPASETIVFLFNEVFNVKQKHMTEQLPIFMATNHTPQSNRATIRKPMELFIHPSIDTPTFTYKLYKINK